MHFVSWRCWMPGITSQSRPHCCLSSAVPGPAFMDLFAFCCRRVVLFDHYQGNDDDGYRLYDILIFLNKQQSEFVDSSPLSLTTSLSALLVGCRWKRGSMLGQTSTRHGISIRHCRGTFPASQILSGICVFTSRPPIHPSIQPSTWQKGQSGSQIHIKMRDQTQHFSTVEAWNSFISSGIHVLQTFFLSFPTHPQLLFIID